MQKLRLFSVAASFLMAVGFSFVPKVQAEQVGQLGSTYRVFYQSPDKCVTGCYMPGGSCLSAEPIEEVDC